MQIPTQLWAAGYLRTVQSAGAFAAVVRHGDDGRGAVIVVVRALDGTAALYVPAPSYVAAAAGRAERSFMTALPPGTAEADVTQRIGRETTFDPDAWVIEVEDRRGRHFLDDWLISATQ